MLVEDTGLMGQKTYYSWYSQQCEPFLLPAHPTGGMWTSPLLADGYSISSGFVLHLRNTELGDPIALK